MSVLSRLEVLLEHRRDGIGTYLIDAAFGHARRTRCCELRLDFDPQDSPEAILFFAAIRGQTPNDSAPLIRRRRWSLEV